MPTYSLLTAPMKKSKNALHFFKATDEARACIPQILKILKNNYCQSNQSIKLLGIKGARYKGQDFFYLAYNQINDNSETHAKTFHDQIISLKRVREALQSVSAKGSSPIQNLNSGFDPRTVKEHEKKVLRAAASDKASDKRVYYCAFYLKPHTPVTPASHHLQSPFQPICYIQPICYMENSPRALKVLIQDQWRNAPSGLVAKKRAAMKKLNPPKMRSTLYGSYTLTGGVLTEPGTFIRLRQEKMRVVLDLTKTPMTAERHIGVEIEASIPRDRWNKLKVDLVASGYAQYMALGTDGSVTSNDDYKGGELRLCIPTSLVEQVIGKVADILANIGAKVDRTCGLHVHLDARRGLFPTVSTVQGHSSAAATMFRKLCRQLVPLYQTQPASRRGNEYCRWITAEDWSNGLDRYHAVNPESFNKYKTIEVRLHAGTINATKITHWIRLVEAIAYGKALKNNYQHVQPMVEMLASRGDITPECAVYFTARALKFENAPSPITSSEGRDYRDYMDRLESRGGRRSSELPYEEENDFNEETVSA